MKKLLVIFCLMFSLSGPPARADLWGGDVAVLTKILVNAIQQLSQLSQIVGKAKENLQLMQEIHHGVNEALKKIKEMDPNYDPGLYRDWRNTASALRNLEKLYGKAGESPNATVLRHADHSVAEAVSLNNAIYAYTKSLDELGKRIKDHSQSVSPGGAQKLTAQSMGTLIQIMNQGLRAQATALKLQAQRLAIENRKDKEHTQHVLDTAKTFKEESRKRPLFQLPEFGR